MPSFGNLIVSTGSQATGRRAFSDIIDELARPVNVGDTTVRAMAADAFRAAVRTMNRKGLWPWEVQEEDLTVTSGLKFSTATGAIKKPLSMHFTNGAGGRENQPVCYEPYDSFLERYTMDIDSEPTVYTIPNLFETGNVQWYPVPSANYDARFAYYRATPAPRAESESVEIPEYVIEVYMAFAWCEFVKRCPSAKAIIDLAAATGNATQAFRELSAHVMTPGDRSRMAYSR